MNIVDRGFISVKGKEPYIIWASKHEEGMFLDNNVDPNIYLIEEDFFEEEPVLKANFKKIFLNELQMVTDDESTYPDITEANFNDWFETVFGNMVFDTLD